MSQPLFLTPLLHQRRSRLPTFLIKRRFEAAKLLRTQFRKHSPHQPGMLSERRNDEVLATRSERDDANTPVFGALDPGDQDLRIQPANLSVAATSALLFGGSNALWPLSGVIMRSASGQARCSAHALSIGQTTS